MCLVGCRRRRDNREVDGAQRGQWKPEESRAFVRVQRGAAELQSKRPPAAPQAAADRHTLSLENIS